MFNDVKIVEKVSKNHCKKENFFKSVTDSITKKIFQYFYS